MTALRAAKQRGGGRTGHGENLAREGFGPRARANARSRRASVSSRHVGRGQYMMIPTPTMQSALPAISGVSGLCPSIHQPQSSERTTNTPPYAAYTRPKCAGCNVGTTPYRKEGSRPELPTTPFVFRGATATRDNHRRSPSDPPRRRGLSNGPACRRSYPSLRRRRPRSPALVRSPSCDPPARRSHSRAAYAGAS